MCELLGISSSEPIDPQGYLRKFYNHSVRHPHGWGLMRKNANVIEVIKEPACASGSRIISEVIRKTQPQTDMMAHIRLATIGAVNYGNCHPYTGFDDSGREWVFMHNGTIYSGTELAKYLAIQKGDTDSERIFLYLLDEINRAIIQNGGAPLSEDRRFEIVSKVAADISPRNKLNFIVYDSEIMYVHKNMRDTLYSKQLDTGVIISTQPLDDDEWESVPMTRLLAYKNGKEIFRGENHGGEFIPNLEYITAMAAMNI